MTSIGHMQSAEAGPVRGQPHSSSAPKTLVTWEAPPGERGAPSAATRERRSTDDRYVSLGTKAAAPAAPAAARGTAGRRESRCDLSAARRSRRARPGAGSSTRSMLTIAERWIAHEPARVERRVERAEQPAMQVHRAVAGVQLHVHPVGLDPADLLDRQQPHAMCALDDDPIEGGRGAVRRPRAGASSPGRDGAAAAEQRLHLRHQRVRVSGPDVPDRPIERGLEPLVAETASADSRWRATRRRGARTRRAR